MGEESQFGWWESDFFGPTSTAFLSPVFPKAQFLAQCEGAAAAARKLHDERVGKGDDSFHLFRLPEELEQKYHELLLDLGCADEFNSMIADQDSALAFLEKEFAGSASDLIGPTKVGSIGDITSKETINSIANAYAFGFRNNVPVFPFLREEN